MMTLGRGRCTNRYANTDVALWGRQLCEQVYSRSYTRLWDTVGSSGLSHTAWWHLQDRQACEKVCDLTATWQCWAWQVWK